MGWSGFMRPLIRPGVGRALIYTDFSAQDTGTAAALSGDPNLMTDYLSGDLYTAFAVRCGADIHGDGRYTAQEIRQRYKIAMLAIMYGMSAQSLARRLGDPTGVRKAHSGDAQAGLPDVLGLVRVRRRLRRLLRPIDD